MPGSKASRYPGFPVTESAPIVLPWNEWFIAMISCSVLPSFKYAYLRAALIAPSMASAPLFVKNTRSMPDTSFSFFAASMAGML